MRNMVPDGCTVLILQRRNGWDLNGHAEVHENDWTAELKVPVKILEKNLRTAEFRRRSYFTCNFYKISESKEAEHYASYSPILSSVPSFHVPEFFADAKIVRQK